MHKKIIERMENQKVSWCLSGKRKKDLKKRFRSGFNRALIQQGIEEYKNQQAPKGGEQWQLKK